MVDMLTTQAKLIKLNQSTLAIRLAILTVVLYEKQRPIKNGAIASTKYTAIHTISSASIQPIGFITVP
jgi:hypothetical protein